MAAELLIGMGAILTTASEEFIARLTSRIECVAGTEVAGEGVAGEADKITRPALQGAGAVATGMLAFNIYKLVKVPQGIQTASTNFEGLLGEMKGILTEIE